MNIKEYILSGIIESYVLGLASEEERKEFEQLCARYAELTDFQGSFEEVLKAYVLENQVAPPEHLRSVTEEAIKVALQKKQQNTLDIRITEEDTANRIDQ